MDAFANFLLVVGVSSVIVAFIFWFVIYFTEPRK